MTPQEMIDDMVADANEHNANRRLFAVIAILSDDDALPEEMADRLALMCSGDLPRVIRAAKALTGSFERLMTSLVVRAAIQIKTGESDGPQR